MTHITMIYDNNLIIGFKMQGHAGYNTKGPDILCSALSSTSQMTINGILDWTGLSVEDVTVECDAKEGMLHIVVPDGLYISLVAQQLFKSFEMYVESLEEQYDKFIKLERRQKDDM